MAYAKSLLYGGTNIHSTLREYIAVPRWQQLNVPFLVAGFVILFFTILGVRAAFAMPVMLKANWVFRITAVHSPRAYFRAVRKGLYTLAALPIFAAALILYLAIWPRSDALAHLLVLGLCLVIIVERALFQFRKVPFTCSYLPGQADKRKITLYGIAFLTLTDFFARIEHWSLQSGARYTVIVAILLALAIRARWRWTNFAATPDQRIQFEENTILEIAALDLHHESGSRAERYVDGSEAERPIRVRIANMVLKSAAIIAVLAFIGACYEQIGRWQHLQRFPQIGRSVDIGGRSLNLFCSGGGGPPVVFESGAGMSGYTWVHVQREVAQFTQACWYDRAGYGWSDPGPFPRDSSAIAKDLHLLLRNAGIAPPYVLAGHSFGGLNVRVYNGLYPQEVAGMVLVDSSHMDDRDSIPPAGETAPSFAMIRVYDLLLRVQQKIGLLRVILEDRAGPPPKGVTAEEWRIATSFEPQTFVENAKELFIESAREARAARGLGDKPLIILTSGRPPKTETPWDARRAIARQKAVDRSPRTIGAAVDELEASGSAGRSLHPVRITAVRD